MNLPPFDAPRHSGDEERDLDRDLDLELAETDTDLATSLAQLLRAPADLERRTQDHVADSLLQRSLIGTASDMLTVGWRTIRFLTNPAPTDNPAEHRREETP